MARTIKHTAIPFGGYLYQNLIGIELLCNWLDDPTLYKWVKFESDDDGTPKGLDDIVALNSDGLLVLLQVKFTVDQFDTNNCLDWDWLLQHKPKGRSLIQKWAEAFFAMGAAKVAEAALVTNRLPDREFHSCLNEATRRVDYDRIPANVQQQLLEQIGSTDNLTAFFHAFEFRHSSQSDQAIERTLRDRYIPHHTNSHGWALLFREAIDWAMRKNFPLPDGRISLDVIRGVLSNRRPAPLVQSFRVPEGYCPPDEVFSQDFISGLTIDKKKVVVLWGSPGQGKSTYLSYLCAELEKQSVPFIRHHYFLDLADTSDRFSLLHVANSLMAQMEAHHVEHVQGLADKHEKLREWIEACAMGYAACGKRFVVVIDGLDHVWRENGHNKRPLDSLFKVLLPTPENVTLLIGTQKVAEEQLPMHFPDFIAPSDWIEIPRMSLSTIRNWLAHQLDAESFVLPDRNVQPNEDQLTEVARAFERISGGHPLILTYSFMALAREQRVLTANVVNEFPVHPDGDIKKYYMSLWKQLSFLAKDALHLIADAGFIWPHLGLESCLGIRAGELGRETGHLFYVTEAGQVAFHGSLLAFIRDEAEHSSRVACLLPAVVNWLSSEAPDFHRWGWLWLYKARTGSTDDLVNMPSREWVIESLAKAYPEEQIVEIFSGAERIAFENGNFARAVRLRWLKTRVQNGKEFQVDDYERLYRCALKISDDCYFLKTLSVNHHAASIGQLHLLGTQYLAAGRVADAIDCQEQLRKRINDHLKAHAFNNDALDEASKQYLELAAATAHYSPDRLLQSIRGFNTLGPELFRFFLREVSRRMDLRALMDFAVLPLPRVMRQDLELAVIRLAGVCRAHVHNWPEFKRFRKHPISACWALIYAPAQHKHASFVTYDSALDAKAHTELPKALAEQYLHGLFFFSVARCLELRGATPVIEEPKFSNRPWMGTAAKQLLSLGATVGKLLARGENPAFALPFRIMNSLSAPEGYESFSDYVPFRRALLTISIDLFLLTGLRSGITEIPHKEWCSARESQHFNFSEWLQYYVNAGYELVAADAIEAEKYRELRKVIESVSPFNERAQVYIELCELAVQQRLYKLAKEILKRALSCVIGYGWRKDPTLRHVLDAVSAVATVDEIFAKTSLIRISPMVSRIDEMTEDAGIRKSDLAELLLELMPASYDAYYEHWLCTSEWYASELVFADLIALESLASPLMNFVTCAIWDSSSIGELRKRADAGDVAALIIVEQNAHQFGQPVDKIGQERSHETPHKDEEHGIDVREYAPNALENLLQALRERKKYASEREAVHTWFRHWQEQGLGLDLLRIIEPYLTAESIPWGVADILDEAFNVCLTLEGKRKAYHWLVAAQIHRHGWDERFSGSVARERFTVFAKHYAHFWKQFIIDTAKPAYRTASESLVIPHHRLVQFLLAVGQVSLAISVTEEMVCTVVEDFSDQPLKNPAWLLGDSKMDAHLIARIGLQRLRLPIPMAKLQIVHGAARALLDPQTNTVAWEALLGWVSSLELESEVLEALCAIVLASNSDVICLEPLRSAICWPSILSDIFISEAFHTPILYNSWSKSHSGEMPPYYRADNIQAELVAGQIVPPILASRMKELERMSGKPMLKQWAYEFDRLLYKLGSQSDGNWSYFAGDDRQRARGQFIGRRGHLARSAYLRTLALAFDVWGMPEYVARSEAMYATPADFSFLKMLPSKAPTWALHFHQAQPNTSEEWSDVLNVLAQATIEQEDARLLLHLNAPTQRSERYQAEVEVITVLVSEGQPSVEEIFRIHDWLPGNVHVARSSEWEFVINAREPDAFFPLNDGIKALPALLPSVGLFVGYFHSDLVGRMPYLPANYDSAVTLKACPRLGGADFELNGQCVGEFRYWNWLWSPTHDKALGTHGAVLVTLSHDSVSQLINCSGMQCTRVWRAKVLSRETDYGEWQEVLHYGMLPF